MEFLGDDLLSIAREKGGIIKEGVPLVIGRAGEGTERLLLAMAEEKQAPVSLAYRAYEPLFQTFTQDLNALFRIRDHITGSVETVTCDPTGNYQQENLITTLTSVGRLKELEWDLPGEAVYRGLASVVHNTGLLGRWQTIGYNPRSICDTAHNPDGIAQVMKQLLQVPFKTLHVVWGMVREKQADQILPLLPPQAHYYFTPSSVPRSMEAEVLKQHASGYGLKGETYGSVEEAYRAAREKAGPNDLIFTGGSTFVVADLLHSTGY
jgi:dihydrofolate synthase/folylpolyglutamate synthase